MSTDGSKPTPTPTPQLWRSLEAAKAGPDYAEQHADEFPHGVPEPAGFEMSRRRFLGVVGASATAAGLASSGCVRKPVEHIVPFGRRPEDRVPGKPEHFSTVMWSGTAVLGLVVESQDGRPTKVEGNPLHPTSNPAPPPDTTPGRSDGASNGWAQAAVLDLYDPERSRVPLQAGRPSTWAALDDALAAELGVLAAQGGRGLAVVLEPKPSPSLRRALAELRRRLPATRVYASGALLRQNEGTAARALGAPGAKPVFDLARARRIVALDADPLATEGESVRNAQLFARGRQVRSPQDEMSRLYVVEPAFSLTGAAADNRLRVKAAGVGPFAAALALELLGRGRDGGGGAALRPALLRCAEGWDFGAWPAQVASDLATQPERSLVLVGERQPPWVHALAAWIHAALGTAPEVLRWVADPGVPALSGLADLARSLEAGEVRALVACEVNPLYDAPADLALATRWQRAPYRLHLGRSVDETAQACTWHAPASHFLECWGDLRSDEGVAAVQQPLIAPLFGTRSELELLARLAGRAPDGHAFVRATWAAGQGPSFEARWRRWLHDGVVAGPLAATAPLDLAALPGLLPSAAAPPQAGLELDLVPDLRVLDGRYANNHWLQEQPDPITKLTWDNAALLAPATARRLGLNNGDRVHLEQEGRGAEAAVWISPGQAEDVVVLSLGHGRRAGGQVLQGRGFDAYRLRSSHAPWFAPGLALSRSPGSYELACTQDHGSMVEPVTGRTRPVVRMATLDQYRSRPRFVEDAEVVKDPKLLRSLWEQPNETKGQQWAMAIDLNACIGCGACTLACQAENNIMTVGKERVLNGREMHWIRVDRYYVGDPDAPTAVMQPLPCQHCETAPCEGVCPVGATAHSPEGLNDMAYNRCIGTRYCSNNCPFKVRRFNFFNYSKEADERGPGLELQRNPDVTVRFRGVMEKCSFCVQRINEARMEIKRAGGEHIPEGAVRPACAQACPSRAIVFGDLNDPSSQVQRQRKQDRAYALLAELNLHPRTTCLAKLRNPNPELS